MNYAVNLAAEASPGVFGEASVARVRGLGRLRGQCVVRGRAWDMGGQ